MLPHPTRARTCRRRPPAAGGPRRQTPRPAPPPPGPPRPRAPRRVCCACSTCGCELAWRARRTTPHTKHRLVTSSIQTPCYSAGKQTPHGTSSNDRATQRASSTESRRRGGGRRAQPPRRARADAAPAPPGWGPGQTQCVQPGACWPRQHCAGPAPSLHSPAPAPVLRACASCLCP